MSRFIACLTVLLLACSAQAAWYPVFTPSYVQLRPGETATLSVYGSWLSGISLIPFQPMTFDADDPTIATVEGYLPTTQPAVVHVTAHRAGVTRARVVERGSAPPFPTTPIIVVAEEELPVAIDVNGVLTAGQTITLKAVSDEPDATFTWYWGKVGGLFTWEVGHGRELNVVPTAPLVYEYWVLMTSARGAGAIGVALQVHPPPTRRRALRH
jgi:hypothetical protein